VACLLSGRGFRKFLQVKMTTTAESKQKTQGPEIRKYPTSKKPFNESNKTEYDKNQTQYIENWYLPPTKNTS
jgi:hypothetical protein